MASLRRLRSRFGDEVGVAFRAALRDSLLGIAGAVGLRRPRGGRSSLEGRDCGEACQSVHANAGSISPPHSKARHEIPSEPRVYSTILGQICTYDEEFLLIAMVAE